MSGRAKHVLRSHRSNGNKRYAFQGFYHHAPKRGNIKLDELPIFGKLFSLFNNRRRIGQ